MPRDTGRVGTSTSIVVSPEKAQQFARAREREATRWRRQSGPTRTRQATGRELEAVRNGGWRPGLFTTATSGPTTTDEGHSKRPRLSRLRKG
jgi:hypothetical protein